MGRGVGSWEGGRAGGGGVRGEGGGTDPEPALATSSDKPSGTVSLKMSRWAQIGGSCFLTTA